jgi:hypothetical protein
MVVHDRSERSDERTSKTRRVQMTTPRTRTTRNGWHEFARWLTMSKWGVRLLLLIVAAIVLAIMWKTILNLVFTAFGIVALLAIIRAMLPKKAKKKL